jgi:hypothetical protein
LKKRFDPLWEIIGEKVYLQGMSLTPAASCPRCHVLVELPQGSTRGERFRCGLCGALCEVIETPRDSGLAVTEILEHA